MPYRRVPTDRAGMNGAAVDAAQARNHGLDRCTGYVTDPPRPDRKPAKPRPCAVRLDPVLVTAGYTTHPCCGPTEISPAAGPPGEPDSLARPAPPATDPADQAPAGKCGGCGHKAHRDECDRKGPVKSWAVLDPATGQPMARACGSRPPCPCPWGWCHACKAPIVGASTLPLDSGAAEIDIDRGSAGDPAGEWAVWKLADGRLACRPLAAGEQPGAGEWRARAHAHQLTPKEDTPP